MSTTDTEKGMTTTDGGAAPTLATMQAHGHEIRQALAVLREAKEFSDLLSSSQFIPQAYRGKPGDVMACLLYGQSIGLGPMQALQGIAVINGRPSVWGDMALAVVRSHPEFVDIDETLTVDRGSEENTVAICTVKRRGQSPTERRFSVSDAKKAGLWGKPGPWSQYAKRMLQMRARGFAIRDAFPDALAGMMFREEAEDFIDVTPPAMAPEAPEGRRMKLSGGAKPNGGTVDAAPVPPVEPPVADHVGSLMGSDEEARAALARREAERKAAPPKQNPGKRHLDGVVCPGCRSTANVWDAFKHTANGDTICANSDHGEPSRFFRPPAEQAPAEGREPGDDSDDEPALPATGGQPGSLVG